MAAVPADGKGHRVECQRITAVVNGVIVLKLNAGRDGIDVATQRASRKLLLMGIPASLTCPGCSGSVPSR